jgi:hypothetical protein
MALLAGSPAIDAGSNAAASAAGLTTDQRGLPRVSNGQVDIGAFEVLGQPPVLPPPVAPVRAIVAALVNNVMVTKKKGRTHLFSQLFVRVSFADTGALKSEFLSPFQRPAYRSIAVTVFNSDGGGGAGLGGPIYDQGTLTVRFTARRGRRTVTQVFTV